MGGMWHISVPKMIVKFNLLNNEDVQYTKILQ